MILIIIGAVLALLFILPVLYAGIINAGNITGILVSAAMIAAGLYRDRITGQLKTILLAVTAVVMLIVCVESCLMIKAAMTRPAQDAVVIVLGCRVKPSGPSRSLNERIDAAYAYLTEHPDAVCIASGGQGKDEPMTEAAAIRDGLVRRGIDPERIYMEDRSTSTRENIRYSLEIIRSEGLPERIAIVTNNYHVFRAMQTARDCGLEAGAVPAWTMFIMFPTYYVRELGGIIATWIVG